MAYSLPEYRGEYKMEGRLGESDSGPVYLAQDALAHEVALKVLSGPIDPELPGRLQAEASLKHKNILPIFGLFQNKTRICIVSELLDGKNLTRFAEDQSLTLLDKIEVMTQVADALRFADANGVSHRDLRPSRIQVGPDGIVKVRTFSIDPVPSGTAYLAPEQMLGQPAGVLSNIFTFGVILKQLTESSAEKPDLLLEMIRRSTNRESEGRYQNFSELLADAVRLRIQLRKTDLHFTGLFESVTPAGPDPTVISAPAPEPVPDSVHFTIYRPRDVRAGEWRTLLVFAHLARGLSEVQQAATQILGRDASYYEEMREEYTVPVPHAAELTFAGQMNGVQFNPRRISLLWYETFQLASFRMRASPVLSGEMLEGNVGVFLNGSSMAELPVRFAAHRQRLVSGLASAPVAIPPAPAPPVAAASAAVAAGAGTITSSRLPAVHSVPAAPPSSRPTEISPDAPPATPRDSDDSFGFQLFALIPIALAAAAISWYALHARQSFHLEKTQIAAPAQMSPAAPEHYSLTLWSRGTAIVPDQVVRGADPLLQVSFQLNAPAASAEGAILQVEWWLNGVSAGVTDFDPSEPGTLKDFFNPPGDGVYKAVLTVNGKPSSAVSFSYRK